MNVLSRMMNWFVGSNPVPAECQTDKVEPVQQTAETKTLRIGRDSGGILIQSEVCNATVNTSVMTATQLRINLHSGNLQLSYGWQQVSVTGHPDYRTLSGLIALLVNEEYVTIDGDTVRLCEGVTVV